MGELTRKEFVQASIVAREAQIQEGVSLESKEILLGEIASFRQELVAIEAADQEQQEQEAAQQVRIQAQEEKREGYTLPTDLNSFFSSASHLDADGQPYVVTNANRIVLQIVKDALTDNDNEHNIKIQEIEERYLTTIESIKGQRDSYKRESEEKDQLIESLRLQLSQTLLEKEDAEAKRDAAIEEKKQREAKESADLAKLIADETAEKERKAAEDRAKRTVYDVVPDNEINPKNYTARLAATGEIISYNWTQKNYYTVLTDEYEVSQFRSQHAQESAVPDLTLAEPVSFEVDVPPVITDLQFQPSLGSIQEGETVSQENTGDGDLSGDAQGVASSTLEDRVAALEAQVFGFVKGIAS